MAKYQISFVIPEKKVSFFENAFDERAEAFVWNLIEEGTNKGLWQASAYFEELPPPADLEAWLEEAALAAKIPSPAYTMEAIEQKNWLEDSFKSFPPVVFGPYYIYGSHITEPQPEDKIALQIDAATAFGTGEHATTQGCLQMLEEVLKIQTPKRVLDMGCGSGILSMALWKRLQEKPDIDAVDIDPESVKMTTLNAKVNQTPMRVFQSDGYAQVTDTYDLVFSNILASPLIQMAPDLYKHLRKGGLAILSGFLTHQKHWVQKAHEEAGFEIVSYTHIKEWGTLVVRRS